MDSLVFFKVLQVSAEFSWDRHGFIRILSDIFFQILSDSPEFFHIITDFFRILSNCFESSRLLSYFYVFVSFRIRWESRILLDSFSIVSNFLELFLDSIGFCRSFPDCRESSQILWNSHFLSNSLGFFQNYFDSLGFFRIFWNYFRIM